MRFTFLVHDRKDYRGGPIVNIRRLLPELHRRGHAINVLGMAGDDSPTLDWLRGQFGIEVVKVPQHLRFSHQRVRWLLLQMQRVRPDIFVPNNFAIGFYAARWARESGIPSIGFLRSDDAFHWAAADQFVWGPECWRLSGVACVSDHLMRRVSERLVAGRRPQLCTIPSGVPIPVQQSTQQSEVAVCYVGRFENEQKQFCETAEALFRNVRAGRCTRIGFFGGGSQEGWLREQIARRGIEERVTMHGAVPPETLHQQLCHYQICVLLSDYEGTPGALMDAMATGLVPIAKAVRGGVRELVIHEKTGLLCHDRMIDFDRCLTRLAGDLPLRRQLASAARAHVKDSFSISRAVRLFEDFSDEVLKRRERQRTLRIPWAISLPPSNEHFRREDSRPRGRLEWIFSELKQMGATARSASAASTVT